MQAPIFKIWLTIATFVAFSPACFAESINITASLDLTAEQVETRAGSPHHSDAVIDGTGDRLRIVYSSPVRVDLDISPVRRGGRGYDPAEILHATLPPGKDIEAVIDLKATPALGLFRQRYILDFYSPEGGDDAEVQDLSILPWNIISFTQALKQHLLIREIYQVSTFHALRGYSLLGISFAAILGMLTLIAFVGSFLVSRFSFHSGRATSHEQTSNVFICLLVFVLGSFLYAGWAGIDLLRFTAGNLQEWYGKGTYNHAGSAEAVARHLHAESKNFDTPFFVYICDDETDFYTKMLRYFAYPIPVSRKGEDIPRVTHVVVGQKRKWSYKDGTLTCGELSGTAKLLADFPDDSHLFVASQ